MLEKKTFGDRMKVKEQGFFINKLNFKWDGNVGKSCFVESKFC